MCKGTAPNCILRGSPCHYSPCRAQTSPIWSRPIRTYVTLTRTYARSQETFTERGDGDGLQGAGQHHDARTQQSRADMAIASLDANFLLRCACLGAHVRHLSSLFIARPPTFVLQNPRVARWSQSGSRRCRSVASVCPHAEGKGCEAGGSCRAKGRCHDDESVARFPATETQEAQEGGKPWSQHTEG